MFDQATLETSSVANRSPASPYETTSGASHKQGCQKLRIIRELLDIATNDTSGKEAVGAVFVWDQPAAKTKRDNPDEPSAGREGRKNKKNHRPPTGNEVTAADRQERHPPRSDNFD